MKVIALIGELSAWPWRIVLGLFMCLAIFITGFVMGQRHVQQAWNAQRLQLQAQTLEQSLYVAQLETQQERINQKISTEYEAQKSILARRAPVLRNGALSLCGPANHSASSVSAIAEPAPSTDAPTTNPVPDAARDAGAIGCEELARDAADTTLMVLSFQRWYAEQAKAQAAAQPVEREP